MIPNERISIIKINNNKKNFSNFIKTLFIMDNKNIIHFHISKINY